MKKNNIINGLFLTLLFAGQPVLAGQQYPAADFQPQVVFQDHDYISKNSKSEVVKSQKSTGNPVVADSKYPASDFQPQIVFSDPNYKSNPGALKANTESVYEPASNSKNITTIANEEKTKSTATYLFGLIGLVIVALTLFKGQSKNGSDKNMEVSVVNVVGKSGLTGVSRYINKISGTGVSRYLEKQMKSATLATGVSKYIAKQAISAKNGNSEATTSVEKYMRKRG